jgi:hypothetical protein
VTSRRWLVAGAWLGAAALLRLSTLFYHDLSGDDATVALMAKHILAGEDFPAFFYRQTYIGSVSGLHLVPALFLFGPSVLLVRLADVAWNLVFLVGLYALGRRVSGEGAARASLALGAVSPFLLTYWMSVTEPHFVANTFGVVLLLLTLVALRTGRGPGYVRTLACFGLTAGVAWWQSFKILEVAVPALLVLWARDARLPLRRAGVAAAAGFAVGSLPAWLFYAARGDAPGQAQQLFGAGLAVSGERALAMLATVVPTLLGTYYWPVDTPGRRAALWAVGAVYAAAVALAAARAARGPWRGPGAAVACAWARGALLLVLVFPFGLLYASQYVAGFDHETARYVLPVYIPLLLFAGELVAEVGRRSRPAAAVLLGGLLAFNLWTNAAFMWPLHPAERARRAAQVAERRAVTEHLRRHPVEALYVDEGGASLRWAFLLDSPPVVSELTTEIYVPSAVRADAARRVAILIGGDPSVSDQLAMLGASARRTRFGTAVLHDEIRVTEGAWRAVPRDGWRVAGEPAPPALADGDLATASPPGAAGAMPLVVDLGALHAVARIVWWPPTDWEQTYTLAVARSPDGERWEAVGALPSAATRRPAFVAGGRPLFRPRDGWLELRPAPRPTRYLRFTPLDPGVTGGWGVAELAVYEASETASPSPPAADPDPGALGRRLRALGVTRLLADPATSARVALASGDGPEVLVANGVLDSHGRAGPPAWLGAPVRLRAGDALLVPAEDAPELRRRLEAGGVTFREEGAGAARLLHGLAPVESPAACRGAAWRIVDGAAGPAGSRLTSTVEARPRSVRRIAGIRLEHPLVSARDVSIESVAVSDDGRSWRPEPRARRLPSWGWAGRTLFRDSEGADELWLPETPARHVRVVLVTPDVEGRSPLVRVCVRGEPAE